jgi:hypothetical protein
MVQYKAKLGLGKEDERRRSVSSRLDQKTNNHEEANSMQANSTAQDIYLYIPTDEKDMERDPKICKKRKNFFKNSKGL